MEETDKPAWGGARKGAGRKKKENARNNRVAFMLSKTAMEALDRLAEEQGTSRNDVINRMLENA